MKVAIDIAARTEESDIEVHFNVTAGESVSHKIYKRVGDGLMEVDESNLEFSEILEAFELVSYCELVIGKG